MILLILALLTGCGAPAAPKPADGKLHIVATVFPAYDFARAAAGDLADVELLLPPLAARETPTTRLMATAALSLRMISCFMGLSSREKSVCVWSPEKVISFQGCLQKITYFVRYCQEILAHTS